MKAVLKGITSLSKGSITIKDNSSDKEVRESSEDDDCEIDEEDEGLSKIYAQIAFAYNLNNFDIKKKKN